jgi:hypothetical protein
MEFASQQTVTRHQPAKLLDSVTAYLLNLFLRFRGVRSGLKKPMNPEQESWPPRRSGVVVNGDLA